MRTEIIMLKVGGGWMGGPTRFRYERIRTVSRYLFFAKEIDGVRRRGRVSWREELDERGVWVAVSWL